ncbi:MAG: alanine racemase [Deltaproteobacteria bacterium]|nr:alanine racemase [Deltaproteobacteria bacterium]
MKISTLSELASITGGKIHDECILPEEFLFYTDSRSVLPGGVFIALKGEQTDGHLYINEAFQNGASAAIISSTEFFDKHNNLVLVDSTLLALAKIAEMKRKNYKGLVIAITGSNGKTIVKDSLIKIIEGKYSVSGSPGSYNSQLGVPLSILSCSDESDLWIIEAGINDKNQMDVLERIIQPDAGILTNIGLAHIGNFKERSAILEEKLKLFKNLTKWLIIPDNEPLLFEYTPSFPVYRHGRPSPNHPYINNFTRNNGEIIAEFSFPGRQLGSVTLNTPSLDIAQDVEMAVFAAYLLDVPSGDILHRSRHLGGSSTRQEIWKSPGGVTIINDGCSSDPLSVESALRTMDTLANDSSSSKVFVFGGMTNLGDFESSQYERIGMACALHGISTLILPKELEHSAASSFITNHPQGKIIYFSDFQFVKSYLLQHLDAGDIVLFKGPRKINISLVAKDLFEAMAPGRLITDLGAVSENIKIFRSLASPGTMVLGMVKALAYGSDLIRIAGELESLGVDMLGVSTPDEGSRLRKEQCTLPILVMITSEDEVHKIIKYNLTPVVTSLELAEALNHETVGPIDIHLKIDTGMGRMGILPEDLPIFLKKLKQLENLRVSGIMTHFSCADDSLQDNFTLRQIDLFTQCCETVLENGFTNFIRHASATSAAIRFPQAHFDMIRIGLGLYGIYPNMKLAEKLHLELAVSLASRIIAVRNLKRGTKVGYSATYEVRRESIRAGVVPMGYHDGLPWNLSGKGTVIIHGKSVPIIGRISMDSMLVDLNSVPEAVSGDDVLIFGNMDGYERRPEEVAEQAGTIVYELISSTGPRVQRIFKGK